MFVFQAEEECVSKLNKAGMRSDTLEVRGHRIISPLFWLNIDSNGTHFTET